jgi:uncharacterized membrane protein
LARVPENTLKFVVGVMLTSFGLFWGAEGVGARWPGSDAALLIIAPAVLVFCLLLVLLFRRRGSSASTTGPAVRRTSPEVGPGTSAVTPNATATATRTEPGRLARFGLFWYDFVIGDDWQIAAGVAAALIITWLGSGWAVACLIPVVAVGLLIPYGTTRAART